MKIPRHSTIAAYGSLFIALGGTGYAATQLPNNSVGSAQIRNGSITQRDIARGVVSKRNAKFSEAVTSVVTDPTSGILNVIVSATDGAQGPAGPVGPQGGDSAVPGPQGGQGVQGDKGTQGIPGGLWAYGAVGVTGGSVSGLVITNPEAGYYCVAPVQALQVLTATAEGDGLTDRAAHVDKAPATGPCAGSDWEVVTQQGGTVANVPFYVMGT